MMKNILTAVLLALLLTCSACTGCNAPAGEPGLSQSGKELSSAADEGTEDTEEIIAAEAISTETEEKTTLAEITTEDTKAETIEPEETEAVVSASESSEIPETTESTMTESSSVKGSEKESSSAPETKRAEKESETSSTKPEPSSEMAPEPSKEPTSAPEPSTQQPSTKAPETQAPETQAPTMQAPETQPPTTQAPETQPPTTQEPETQPPETTAAPHKHSYTSKVTKQPTCQETGVKTYTCSCGDSYTEAIPVTDHHYVEKIEESVVTVTDSEAFTVNVCCSIPRYFVSYTHNEDGTWDFLGTWQDTIQYGVPQTEWFYDIPENYVMDNGHNSNELIAYMRNAGYRYICIVNDLAGDSGDACDRWLRCIGEFSDGPKNPDHGFREHYGPSWWCHIADITVPAVTHQETVTTTYCECSVCGQRQ